MLAILTLLVGLAAGALIAAALLNRRMRVTVDAERAHHDRLVSELRQAGDEKLALVQREREQLASRVIPNLVEQLDRLAKESRRADHEAASGELKARAEEIKSAVAPITEQLRKVETQVHELDKERRQTHGAVSEMGRRLGEELGRLRMETGHLVSALKRPQVRGAWGEMQLHNVVRAANMTEHVDFHTQQTLDAGDDGRLRPDMTVHLPSARQVVVDSKVPLDAFLQAVEARDDEERERQLDRHARQLRTHLDKLASKAYHAQLDTAAEFVVCFLPNEAVYSAALDRDPGLLEHGATKGVLIATPTTLLALLYACAYGWQQASINEAARDIAAAATELHRRSAKFLGDFARAGRGLQSAVSAYNAALGSLQSRVLPQLRRMEGAGARSEKRLEQPAPLDTAPRLVSAPELLAAGEESDAIAASGPDLPAEAA